MLNIKLLFIFFVSFFVFFLFFSFELRKDFVKSLYIVFVVLLTFIIVGNFFWGWIYVGLFVYEFWCWWNKLVVMIMVILIIIIIVIKMRIRWLNLIGIVFFNLFFIFLIGINFFFVLLLLFFFFDNDCFIFNVYNFYFGNI